MREILATSWSPDVVRPRQWPAKGGSHESEQTDCDERRDLSHEGHRLTSRLAANVSTDDRVADSTGIGKVSQPPPSALPIEAIDCHPFPTPGRRPWRTSEIRCLDSVGDNAAFGCWLLPYHLPSPWRILESAHGVSSRTMRAPWPSDIYTEPKGDPNTLANLGPLRPMAGVWTSDIGVDDHPVVDGADENRYVERMELQPIDRQTNGPQLFYGLRYHTHIVKRGEVETFHDQVGYWLWEPETKTVIMTLAIPRAQVALAGGTAEPDAKEFELHAERGSTTFGICSGPFLDQAFTTKQFTIRVTIHPDGRWSYDEFTFLAIHGREGLFQHHDRSTLRKIAEPSPNPLAAVAITGTAPAR